MHYRVHPSALTGGETSVPGDKSISHRALMLSAIADGESTIRGMLRGEDCLATLTAVRQLGVRVDEPGDGDVRVHGAGLHGLMAPGSSLDMGNSGTAIRLFAGLLSAQAFDSRLVGDASLSRRPMRRVVEPLEHMGARIDTVDGKPPLSVHGGRTLRGIDYDLPVASAQVKSALLLAGLHARGRTVIREPAVTRDHTERLLRAMGVRLDVAGGRLALEGQQSPRAVDLRVPGDLSSAAFLVLAGLISRDAEVLVRGVGVNPTRSGVIDVLRRMGADLELENRRQCGEEPVADLRARPSALHGIDVDPAIVSLAIDEFPVLFVAAAVATGRTRFRGIGELRVKESDRIAAMAAGLKQLGIAVNESADGAVVQGGQLGGGSIESCGDHRIAMAFAVAATIARAPVTVRDTAAVETSFPGFVSCLRAIGAEIRESEGGTA
ncbi:MAG: 3-phosphoshikimate 1-carboxyvinyltransferase [Woeseiaceae bacterium]